MKVDNFFAELKRLLQSSADPRFEALVEEIFIHI
jgi:hypothetical protein